MSNNGYYTFWALLENYSIEIPIIQRDYAQGRDDDRVAQIRNGFLDAILTSLNSGYVINLDFIYGSNHGGKLILLDGQQRMTTLFLLHWYLATRSAAFMDITSVMEKLCKFSYETRISSREFCAGLCKHGPLLPPDQEPSLSIKDKPWFARQWRQDPTIASMLVMLDCIHDKWLNQPHHQHWLELTGSTKNCVRFQFLNIKEVRMTDDLYIKMNARGKPLSDFENFKAELEKQADERGLNADISPINWVNRLDIEWSDLFWRIKDTDNRQFDEVYLNFFKSMTLFSYACSCTALPAQKEKASKEIQNIIKKLYDFDYFTSAAYRTCGAFDVLSLNNSFKILDFFAGNPIYCEKYLSLLTSPKVNLSDRALCYAFIAFILQMPNVEQFDFFYSRWERVCGNLVRNTAINDAYDLARACHSLADMSKRVFADFEGDVYKFLEKTSEIGFFTRNQYNEERQKAMLIMSGNGWESLIKEAEAERYFMSQIGFLLKFATYSDVPDPVLFRCYLNKAKYLFNVDFLNRKDYLLQRALLCQGLYLPGYEPTLCFCLPKHATLRDREENWRKVFRDDKRQIYLRGLLDKIDANDIEGSLLSVIADYEGTGWESYFIRSPALLGFCWEKNIYKKNNAIYLLRKSRIYGYHGELLSYYFYAEHIMQSDASCYFPFRKHGYHEDTDINKSKYGYVEGWKYGGSDIYISVTGYDLNRSEYHIWVSAEKEVSLPEEVSEIAKALGIKDGDAHSVVSHPMPEGEVLDTFWKLVGAFSSLERALSTST